MLKVLAGSNPVLSSSLAHFPIIYIIFDRFDIDLLCFAILAYIL